MAASQGRTRGSRNKSTLKQEEKARQLGVDPFEILLLFAKGDWKSLGYESDTVLKTTKFGVIEVERIPPELRQKSASDACQYLLPKLRAIEIQMDNNPFNGPRPLKDLTDEELDNL